jgi:hypothetical protein
MKRTSSLPDLRKIEMEKITHSFTKNEVKRLKFENQELSTKLFDNNKTAEYMIEQYNIIKKYNREMSGKIQTYDILYTI